MNLDIWEKYGFNNTAASTWQQLKDRLLWMERNGEL